MGENKGNVLVIGNSGVGKSTLINAVLGEKKADAGWGLSGTTRGIQAYGNDSIPFRLIDTAGFEPSFFNTMKAVNDVRKWSREGAKKGHEDNQINVIWFCVDGCARKLFSKSIEQLSRATSIWESVPLIVVITKSYSVPEREQNIEMVHNAFAKQKRYSNNLQRVIPVVAETYVLNQGALAAPEGITELIDATNKLMPEGIRAAGRDLSKYILSQKRTWAQGLIAASTAAAVGVGAIPSGLADSMILTPMEVAMINGLSRIYDIPKDEDSNRFINSIISAGTVGTVAKAAIAALKSIPGINLAASVLDAVIAGTVVAALGETSIYAFEQVYLGNRKVSDIDWAQKIVEATLTQKMLKEGQGILSELSNTTDKKEIVKIIMKHLAGILLPSKTQS